MTMTKMYPGMSCNSIELFVLDSMAKAIHKGKVIDFAEIPLGIIELIKEEIKKHNWPCILIGHVKIIWRGYNLPELSVWYFVTVEKFKSNVEQYIWRIIRKFKDKTSCDWYDFCDIKVKFLASQSYNRDWTYKKEFPKSPIKYIYPTNNYFEDDELWWI